MVKDYLLYKFLKWKIRNTIILFTDGYDTMFVCPPDEIKSKFISFNKNIVFAAERNCWPDPTLSQKYSLNSTSSSSYQYLNSGGFIGYSDSIKKLLKKQVLLPNKKFSWSNQYLWTLKYLEAPEEIALDVNCEIFYTLSTKSQERKYYYKTDQRGNKKIDYFHPEFLKAETAKVKKELVFTQGRIKSQETQSTPCHIHFNGPIGTNLMEGFFFKPSMPWVK